MPSGQQYSKNANCRIVVTAPAGYTLVVLFTTMDIEAGYDQLTMYDGTPATNTLLGSFSGSTLPPPIGTTTNTLEVAFSSDATIALSGAAFNVART